MATAAPRRRSRRGAGTTGARGPDAGGALALQIYDGSSRFSAEAVVPQIVAIGMVRELGPVLVGLMVAARVTSSKRTDEKRGMQD